MAGNGQVYAKWAIAGFKLIKPLRFLSGLHPLNLLRFRPFCIYSVTAWFLFIFHFINPNLLIINRKLEIFVIVLNQFYVSVMQLSVMICTNSQ